jgi:hypothetical protein
VVTKQSRQPSWLTSTAAPRHFLFFILFQASVHKVSEGCFRSVYTVGE